MAVKYGVARYKFTWAAIIIGFVLTIVGLALGGVAKYIYQFFLSFFIKGTIFDYVGGEIVSEIIFFVDGGRSSRYGRWCIRYICNSKNIQKG